MAEPSGPPTPEHRNVATVLLFDPLTDGLGTLTGRQLRDLTDKLVRAVHRALPAEAPEIKRPGMADTTEAHAVLPGLDDLPPLEPLE